MDYVEWTDSFLSKLTEKTIGAVRHIIEKSTIRNRIPVGFSIVFYNHNEPSKRWSYDMRVIIERHDPDLQSRKTRDRIKLVNLFLSEGVKRIMDGKHDDMIVDPSTIEGQSFQIPGLKGKG